LDSTARFLTKTIGIGIVFTSTMLINPHAVDVLTNHVQALAAPITRQGNILPAEIRRREYAQLGLEREDGVILHDFDLCDFLLYNVALLATTWWARGALRHVAVLLLLLLLLLLLDEP
jgi:hypothetical protein